MMIVDGVLSSVGSTNFDDRSFETNDEITLGILDEGIAAKFDATSDEHPLRRLRRPAPSRLRPCP